MKILPSLVALAVLAGCVSSSFAADATRPTTIGGGVKHPWSPPYMVAMAEIPAAPAMLGLLGTAGALIFRRKK